MKNEKHFKFALLFSVIALLSCSEDNTSNNNDKEVPKIDNWGIYALDLETNNVELIYSSIEEIEFLSINISGDKFAFAQKINGIEDTQYEICCVNIDGSGFSRLTDNDYMDVYPAWSPAGDRIAYLSFPDETLDIFVMDSSGENQGLLYNSGFHDADIHWSGDIIVFTRNSQIWSIKDDGTDAKQITNPPKAGEWGNANLPFGDYDPRLSPDNNKIVFERLVDDESVHGNYDIFMIDTSGNNETRLTNTGYSQGLASWSNSSSELVFIVAAINDVGKYDIYMMNADGSNNRNITPDYFPMDFLCHTPLFSKDDSKIYFIGQWWEN